MRAAEDVGSVRLPIPADEVDRVAEPESLDGRRRVRDEPSAHEQAGIGMRIEHEPEGLEGDLEPVGLGLVAPEEHDRAFRRDGARRDPLDVDGVREDLPRPPRRAEVVVRRPLAERALVDHVVGRRHRAAERHVELVRPLTGPAGVRDPVDVDDDGSASTARRPEERSQVAGQVARSEVEQREAGGVVRPARGELLELRRPARDRLARPGDVVPAVEDAQTGCRTAPGQEPRPPGGGAAVAALSHRPARRSPRGAPPSGARARDATSPPPSDDPPRGAPRRARRRRARAAARRPGPRRPRRRPAPRCSVRDEIRCLPGPRRDERHAAGHRLQDAFPAALLARGDRTGIERVVRLGEALASVEHPMREPDAASARPCRTYPRAGPVRRTTRSGTSRDTRSSASTSTSGPLIDFDSRPSPNPVPSLTSDPTTNASTGKSNARLAASRRAGSTSGKASSSNPIGIRCTRPRATPTESTSSSISRCVAWDPLEAGGVAP